MTSRALALPTTSNVADWNDEEKAIVEAAGLVHTDSQTGQKSLAERPVVAAFLAHCAQTQLNPLARQIYCIARKSKGQLRWQIQISIDGARLVAERSGKYRGQTTPEFTGDGVTWTQVWLAEEPPKAARVGVRHEDFPEPLYAVALWDAYAVYDDVWESGRKTGEKKPSAMWAKMGPLMLAKCAEMLALRKAFPQDLSGLYSSEEMQQAGGAPVEPPASQRPAVAAEVPNPEPINDFEVEQNVTSTAKRDWAADVAAATDIDGLRSVYRDAQQAGVFAEVITFKGEEQTVEAALWEQKKAVEAVPVELNVPKPAKARARDWVREARALDAGPLRALIVEASAAGAAEGVLEQMEDLYRSLPADPAAPVGDWASDGGDDRWQGTPAVLDADVVDDGEVI